MTERETELTNDLLSASADTSVKAAVDLCHEYLFPRKEFEKAELLLLERVGIQTFAANKVVDLTLAELYLHLEETPRAKRFLAVAKTSGLAEISEKAEELLASIESSS